MIRIIEREMRIPKSDKNIGFIGDNKTEMREFEITDKSLFDFDFKLDLKVKSHIGIVDLEKTIEPDRIILKWEILKEHLPEQGMLFAQLRGIKDTGEVWHSDNESCFYISKGINAEEYFPSPLPNEFQQIEQRVTTAKNETVVIRDNIIEKANEVETNTQLVSKKTDTILQKASEVEINSEAVTQNTKSAADSANIAAQTLADLLAMIGTDIATLTNGKLTASQIPAIAITNTFVVNSESAMLALTAETGDVCIRTDESKSYVLQGVEPACLSDWKYLQAPTNYADMAEYAATAGNAENSDRINGHRVVCMTEAQYNAAVKDPDTLYMVGAE